MEVEPTTKYINENIFEEDLTILVCELVNSMFEMLNEGKEDIVIKQHVLDYFNNYKLNLQEIYYWLLNNQDSNADNIYLLGYFNYYGIEIDIDKQKAFELYRKAAK